MTEYTTRDIRNIAIVGQSGAGKTTLTEALLCHGGAIHTPGTIERGTTVSDFDPQEKQYQHSLDASLVHFSSDGKQINMIDTPGLNDFFGRTFGVLQAAETTAIVINAETGVAPATITMMEHAKNNQRCCMLIVNKIDTGGVDLKALMEEIQDTFGKKCLPINLPAPGGDKVVDCFFSLDDAETAFSSVPEAHTNIIDQVVEVDEALMEIYLEQGEELEPTQLHDPFEKALRERHLIPVCFTSVKNDIGVKQLIRVITQLMPDPTEGNPPHFFKGEGDQAQPVEVTPDTDAHAIAHVFRISNDPYRGKLGVFRVYQGTITPNSQLFVGDGRKPFKVTHLYRIQGKEQTEMEQAIPGDICAVARVEEVFRDAVLHDSHDEDNYHLQPEEFPPPLFGLAIIPQKRGDEQKLSDALSKLTAEDPCLSVEHDAHANETVIRGIGELHLRIILEQLEQRYNVTVDTRPPSIPYRETIGGAAEGHHRHKKQTGGAGQFGEVFLKVSPLARGTGFKLVDEVKGGTIPGQFIPAVEKGVRQVLDDGFVAGHPVLDLKVTVYDGSFHAVDSKEIAFVTAGKKAFQAALKKARPIILEPLVDIRITVPEQSIGDITSDLSTKRGRINNTEMASSGYMTISGTVPLAELESYSSTLKSITGGEGSYEISFSHYDQVPDHVQKELVERHKERASA